MDNNNNNIICNVCCESFNRSTRKDIKCQYCDYICCKKCLEKYILDSIENKCMSCNKVWSSDFIDSNFTKTFINNELKQHTQQTLMNREKSLLIATQVNVIAEKNIRNLKKKNYRIHNDIYALKDQIRKLERESFEVNTQIIDNTIIRNNQKINNKEYSKFIRKCPLEDCKGFLSSQWKCGLCEKYICNKCNEIKLDAHICNEDSVKTLELLNKDTKPCPKCGTMITKIVGGCDQMWCIDCHTAFSWNKGIIESGVVHNPHYYEWMRMNSKNGEIPRTLGDEGPGNCNNNNNIPTYYNFLHHIRGIENKNLEIISKIHNVCTHMEYGINTQRHVINNNQCFLDLRIRFLLNEITEENWKREIFLLEKKKAKATDFNNLNVMFRNVAASVFNDIMINKHYLINEMEEILGIFSNLRIYYNECSEKIGKKYSCVYPGISNKYTYLNNAKIKK